MILAISFLIIGFVFLGVTDAHLSNIQDSDCTNGKNGTQIFQYGQEAYVAANNLLCTAQCTCNITSDSVKADFIKENPARAAFINANGVTKVQDCKTYNDAFSNSDIKNQANWLRSLEESFDCTGMCTKPANIYFFSSINNGVPDSDTCKQKFEDFVSTYGKVIYIVGLIVGAYLLINAILSCCLCCRKKSSGQSYYERFANF